MTVREKFSADEWELLYELPVKGGWLTALASFSGLFGTIAEFRELSSSLALGVKDYPENALIVSMNSRYMDREAFSKKLKTLRPPVTAADKVAAMDAYCSISRDAAALVRARVPEFSEEYLQWLVQICENVSKAAKEGAFLGIGGTLVSENEHRFIENIKNAIS